MIKKAKPYWAAFNASSYIKELTVGNIWLVHGYSNDIFQANLDAQAAGRKFKILQGMPKEGAVLAVDNMVIDKSAPRADLALKFMNFMLEGQNSAELTNLIGSGNPNIGRGQVHQARAPQESGDLPGQGGPGEARAAAGPDRRATPPAQQAVDRDQGRALSGEPAPRDRAARAGRARPRHRAGRAQRARCSRISSRRSTGSRSSTRACSRSRSWMAPAPGAPLLPVRAVAAALGALRHRHQRRRVRAVRILRRAGRSAGARRPGRLAIADRRRRAAVVRDGNAADVPADARRERRRPARQHGGSGAGRRAGDGASRARRARRRAIASTRDRWFLPGTVGDLGLALLAIWLVVQVNPGIPLFATMYDPAPRPDAPGAAPDLAATVVEGAHSAFQLLGVGLFLALLAARAALRRRRRAAADRRGGARQGRRGRRAAQARGVGDTGSRPPVSLGVAAGSLLLSMAIWLPRPAQVTLAAVALLSSLLATLFAAGPPVRARAARRSSTARTATCSTSTASRTRCSCCGRRSPARSCSRWRGGRGWGDPQ